MTPPPPRVLTLPGGEPILHYGPADGPQLLVLQPLFEEMNRCRALVAALCRGLAAQGIGCWQPDLPGCGDSVRALETVGWGDWTTAIDDARALIAGETGGTTHGAVSIRGGALLDAAAARRWRLSPVAGKSLFTDLRRAGLLASGAYALGDGLSEPLGRADTKGAARIVRLAGDEREADRHVEGPIVWRRSEPVAAPDLAAVLADDIAAWCAA